MKFKLIRPLLLPPVLMLLLAGCDGDAASPIPTYTPRPTIISTPMPPTLGNETKENVTCALTGGEIVKKGWSGKDTGSNFCNQCMCMSMEEKDAGLACTKMACSPTVTAAPTHTPLASNSVSGTSATSVPSDTLDLEKTIRVLKLQNFLLENLGPYDSTSSTFGDLKYDSSFRIPVFYEFGISRIDGQGNTHYNPTFEFKVPADTLVTAPISGAITWFEWQASENDWEIHIKPSVGSELILGIDHVVSIDCDRATSPAVVCDSPLKINGNVVFDGMSVDAGDVIGYVGHLSGYENAEINGKTELTVFKYLGGFEGTMNYCPTLYLDEAVESTLKDAIVRLMQSYEEWSGKASTYNQETMVAPGCLYETIKQVGAITEPITK